MKFKHVSIINFESKLTGGYLDSTVHSFSEAVLVQSNNIWIFGCATECAFFAVLAKTTTEAMQNEA